MAGRKVARGRDRIRTAREWALPFWQLGALLITVAVCDSSAGRVLATSVLAGGLAFAIPHCWYTWYVLGSLREGATPGWIHGRFLRGEMNKMGLTALSCAFAFVSVQPLDEAGFFLAFITMMVLSWANAARLAYVTDQV